MPTSTADAETWAPDSRPAPPTTAHPLTSTRTGPTAAELVVATLDASARATAGAVAVFVGGIADRLRHARCHLRHGATRLTRAVRRLGATVATFLALAAPRGPPAVGGASA